MILGVLGMALRKIGEGNYNVVFYHEKTGYVIKFSKEVPTEKDNDYPDRAVRVWNEINAKFGEAHVVHYKEKKVWTCPYIKGRQATDAEISKALIDIYDKTGRIITDAPTTGNFLTSSKGTVCVDVDCALLLDFAEKRHENYRRHRRKNSEVSDSFWKDVATNFVDYFAKTATTHPISTNTIKALLFLRAFEIKPRRVQSILEERDLTIEYLAQQYEKLRTMPIEEVKEFSKTWIEKYSALKKERSPSPTFFKGPNPCEEECLELVMPANIS